MTSPVVTRVIHGTGPNCGSEMSMHFMLPFAYWDKPIAPTNPAVYIHEYPAMDVYVSSSFNTFPQQTKPDSSNFSSFPQQAKTDSSNFNTFPQQTKADSSNFSSFPQQTKTDSSNFNTFP
ncbi:heme-binding protein 2-like [Elysia marginata]|uniref:Heme-binding protein 2-like n=1 Tax=Elysia marginata TaxID=1093978 RepID=A0AAV4I348_9GAST|nr:heme-binding protein 2-like [Elysia marginata]